MVFIKGNFPSFKNSKQYTGKYFIMSKTVQKYLKEYENQWKIIPDEFKALKEKDYPVKIGVHIVRGNKRRYDYHNGLQGVFDLMVKHEWIPDDSMFYVFPYPFEINGQLFTYDKENPGVYIKLIK